MLLTWLAGLSGCATGPVLPTQPLSGTDCLRFYHELDDAITRAGVGDASAASISGYPFLRTNRFLVSLTADLAGSEGYQAWVAALAGLDLQLRRVELANLPLERRYALTMAEGIEPADRLQQCSVQLTREVQQDRDHWQVLQGIVKVPDNYIGWQRVVGLYPLARSAARLTLSDLHERLREPFLRSPAELPVRGQLLRYQPSAGAQSVTLPGWLAAAGLPGLDIPSPDRVELARLFDHFSPIIEVDTLTVADRIGRIGWDSDGRPLVDTRRPVVYRYPSYARFQDRKLLQLNYLFWFPARDTGDIYSGQLDALIWRVTLDSAERPLAYDSIHACGCYYQLFPLPGYRLAAVPDAEEPVLVPITAPASAPSQRLVLRLAAGTHYLQALYSAGTGSEPETPYQPLDYQELLSMPMPAGGRRSLFRPDGLVAGSERWERYLLWPFGVLSAGAMRQPGTHAIAFIGRRHFDDPRLLETLLQKQE